MDELTNVMKDILLELKQINTKLDVIVGAGDTDDCYCSLQNIYDAVDYMHDNMIELAGKIIDAIYANG